MLCKELVHLYDYDESILKRTIIKGNIDPLSTICTESRGNSQRVLGES